MWRASSTQSVAEQPTRLGIGEHERHDVAVLALQPRKIGEDLCCSSVLGEDVPTRALHKGGLVQALDDPPEALRHGFRSEGRSCRRVGRVLRWARSATSKSSARASASAVVGDGRAMRPCSCLRTGRHRSRPVPRPLPAASWQFVGSGARRCPAPRDPAFGAASAGNRQGSIDAPRSWHATPWYRPIPGWPWKWMKEHARRKRGVEQQKLPMQSMVLKRFGSPLAIEDIPDACWAPAK